MATKTATKKKVKEAPAFNPYGGDINTVLDGIEKQVELTEATLNHKEKRMSTGLLCLDVVLGGGITAGWYTNFGQEQCCKSTCANTIMLSAVTQNVPVVGMFDFEGCVTGSTKLETSEGSLTFDELHRRLSQGGSLPNIVTLGGHAIGTFFDGGMHDTHRMETESGHVLEGYKHPVLVWDPVTETASHVLIEDLKVGMIVLVRE
jgi:hypothetical protein